MTQQTFANLFEAIAVTHDDGRFIPHGKPARPTQSRPGTPEKLRVMQQRIAAGVELHHPEDLTCRASRYEELLTRIEDEPYRVHFADGAVESICTDPWNEG